MGAESVRLSANVLGETRPILKTWPDGSYDCPWCTSAVIASQGPVCRNPWCVANPDMPVEDARRLTREAAERKAEREARQRIEEERRRYYEEREREHRQFIAATEEEARKRGACLNPACLFPKYRGTIEEAPKYVRHRRGCPKVGR